MPKQRALLAVLLLYRNQVVSKRPAGRGCAAKSAAVGDRRRRVEPQVTGGPPRSPWLSAAASGDVIESCRLIPRRSRS